MPQVSVVMPVYNADVHLAQAIDSILEQTFEDFEFIIIDDGSTDRSKEIVDSYTDHRIKFSQHNQNLNLVRTLNEGIDLSSGEYIARMDADDIADPDRLKKQVAFMEDNPEVGAVGTWVHALNHPEWEQIKYNIGDEDIKLHLVKQVPFAHPTVMMRKKVLDAHHLRYDQEFLEDYRLWFELSKVTQLANIPEYLLTYRFHEDQFSKRFLEFHKKNAMGLQREILESWANRRLSEEESSILIRIFRSNSNEEQRSLQLICALFSDLFHGMTQMLNFSKEKTTEYLIHHVYRICSAHAKEGLIALKLFSSLPFVSRWEAGHILMRLKLGMKIIFRLYG